MTLEPGQRIGRYVLRKKLGQGGFGEVYIAQDVELGREVALKFLLSQHTQNAELLARFMKEARTAAKIDHAGIVTVHECGVVDDMAFIAMELLKGESLAVRIAGGPMTCAVAIEITRQVAAALAVAHDAGVVHRDLKPDNVLLVPDRAALLGERVKVLDFGIAKLAEDPDGSPTGTSLTSSIVIFGTPRYMSPEQCRSTANVDGRTDIYALGVIAFEMIAGRRPFNGESGELIAAHQLTPPPRLRERVPGVAPALEQLVNEMLAKKPEHRPQTMTEVVRRLDEIAPPPAPPPKRALGTVGVAATLTSSRLALASDDVGTDATMTPVPEPVTPVARPVPQAVVTTPVRPPRTRGLVIAGVGVVALGGAAYFVLHDRGTDAPHDSVTITIDAAKPDAAPSDVPAGMVRIPATTFAMGSTAAQIDAAFAWCKTLDPKNCTRALYEREQPVRSVEVSEFFLDRSERSTAEVVAWLRARPVRFEGEAIVVSGVRIALFDRGRAPAGARQRGIVVTGEAITVAPGFERLPATDITFAGARAFCQAQGFDLPTEAQWERAARGSLARVFPWGDARPDCTQAVFERAPGGRCAAAGPVLVDVGTELGDRSPEGVLHLAGNVSEWVLDRFVDRYVECGACRDPIVTPGGIDEPRGFRGGSGYGLAEQLRGAGRARDPHGQPARGTGFRCAKGSS
ncbi:MAG: bifunctional serine/threonine-protein kinase/formylglycine-generating enzyme family protein [Kofleriaceae bacterium]